MTLEDTFSIANEKQRLVDATVRLILAQGFSSTSVEQICTEAGAAQSSFFEHFDCMEESCEAAMDAWAASWRDILTAARLDRIADPLDRLDWLFDVMAETYLHPWGYQGCVIGTVAQETTASNRRLGDVCEAYFGVWSEDVRNMLADAKKAHPPMIDFDPGSVADLMLGLVQGALLVAKTRRDHGVILNNLQHCRAYVLGLFHGNAVDSADRFVRPLIAASTR